MTKKKVFISFDFDQDKALKDLLIGQSHNPEFPFDVTDSSLKEAAPEKGWEEKAAHRIRKADQVIVLLGPTTYLASGVLKEVGLAREHGKKIVQLIGHKGGHYKRVPGAGRLYRWTWDNLKKIIC
jgi:nucleoside 2-deoxyribosyltransferase